MAESLQNGLVLATQVARDTPVRRSANGLSFATFGETGVTDLDLDRMLEAVPAPIVAALKSNTYYFVPLALRDNLEYNNALHEHVVIVSVGTGMVPHVDPSEQIVVDDLDYTDDDVLYLTIQYGFQDTPDVPAALRRAAEHGMLGDLEIQDAIHLRLRDHPRPRG